MRTKRSSRSPTSPRRSTRHAARAPVRTSTYARSTVRSRRKDQSSTTSMTDTRTSTQTFPANNIRASSTPTDGASPSMIPADAREQRARGASNAPATASDRFRGCAGNGRWTGVPLRAGPEQGRRETASARSSCFSVPLRRGRSRIPNSVNSRSKSKVAPEKASPRERAMSLPNRSSRMRSTGRPADAHTRARRSA